jgi:hypothetical protein
MTRLRTLQTATLLSLSTLLLDLAGCSQGQSPTEPAGLNASVAAKSLSAAPDKSHGGSGRGGSDDPAGDDHRDGQTGGTQTGGADDPAGHHRGDRNGDQQRPPRAGSELEGAVATVDVSAGTVALAGGKRIAVNAQTRFDPKGDLFTLATLADAVTAGKRVRVEARGTLQASGSLLATTVKAEIGHR